MSRSSLSGLLCALALGALGSRAAGVETVTAQSPEVPPPSAAPAATPVRDAAPPPVAVREAIETMEKAMTDVFLLIDATRAQSNETVTSCLLKKMAQIANHRRFAKKVNIDQLDTARQRANPAAPEVAKEIFRRLGLVVQLRAEAVACAGEYASLLESTALPEVTVTTEEMPPQFVYGTVFVDTRPPAASPFQ